jgi:predicted nucleic acid-binding protein
MRATLDSGILVRGSTSPGGSAARLIAELVPPRHQIVLSEFILDEFSRVMGYARIQRREPIMDIDVRANRFRMASEMVEPEPGPPVVLADPNDDPIVYTAVAGKADFLCTCDNHFKAPNVIDFLNRHGIRVISDVDLIRELLLRRPEGHSA